MTNLNTVDLQLIQNLINQRNYVNASQMSHSIQSIKSNCVAEWEDDTFHLYKGEEKSKGIKMIIGEEENTLENVKVKELTDVVDKTKNQSTDGTVTQFKGNVIIDGTTDEQAQWMDIAEDLEWQTSPEPGMKFKLMQDLQEKDELMIYYDYNGGGYKTWIIDKTLKVAEDGTLTCKGESELTLPIRCLANCEYII